MTEYVGVL
jgi:NADH:ubiquinone oxidoreductase subunit 3 (subunit A)